MDEELQPKWPVKLNSTWPSIYIWIALYNAIPDCCSFTLNAAWPSAYEGNALDDTIVELYTVRTLESSHAVGWCIFILALCVLMEPIATSSGLEGKSRGRRQFRWILETLLAPETLVLKAIARSFEAYQDAQNARLLGIEKWTWSLAFLATPGDIFVQENAGKTAALPRPTALLTKPLTHSKLWEPNFQAAAKQLPLRRTANNTDLIMTVLLMSNPIYFVYKVSQISANLKWPSESRTSVMYVDNGALTLGDTLSPFIRPSPLELYTLIVCVCSLLAQIPSICVRKRRDAAIPTFISVDSIPTFTYPQVIIDPTLVRSTRRHVVRGLVSRRARNASYIGLHMIKMGCMLWGLTAMDVPDIQIKLGNWLSNDLELILFFCFTSHALLLLLNAVVLTPSSRRIPGAYYRGIAEGVTPMWLIFVNKQVTISIERMIPYSTTSDKIKMFFQSCTHKPIIWWPLVEPLSSLQPGRARISWLSENFEDLSLDLPMALADRFQARLVKAIVPNEEASLSQRSSPARSGATTLSSMPQVFTAIGTTKPSRPIENQRSGRSDKTSHRQYPLDPSTSFELQTRVSSPTTASKFIHWCIGATTAHVQNICVEAVEGAKTGTNFIKELITSYRKFRGVRWWFSLTDLANVKIIQFVRIHNKETPVTCRRSPVKLSDIKAHPEYEIETSDVLDDELHIIWAEAALKQHLQDNCDREEEINAVIAALPRRKIESTKYRARSTGYGIIAEQGWAVWKFLVMVIFSMTIGLIFFVWWLKKHPGDLQNASIPFFMILAAMGLLVAIPDYIS